MAGKVSFQPTEADHAAAQIAWWWTQMRRPGTAGAFAAGLAVSFGFGLLIGSLGRGAGIAWLWPGVTTAGFVAIFGGLMALARFRHPRIARTMFRQTAAFRRPLSLEWDGEGTVYTSAGGTSRTAWEDYHGWIDGRGAVLLMLNDALFQFVPHRTLSAGELADLRAHAARIGGGATTKEDGPAQP